MYYARKLKLGNSGELDQLAISSGRLYSEVLTFFWRTVRRKGIFLKDSSMMRLKNSKELHAHSADAVVQSFYANFKSYNTRRKIDPSAKPPKRRRKFYKIQWKKSAIKVVDGLLILSNGRGNKELRIPWRWSAPILVEIGFDGEQYELRAIYKVEPHSQPKGNKVAAIDLGEVHPMVIYDGEKVIIVNGREARSKRRFRNKIIGELSSLLSRTTKGSRRYNKLTQSKRKQLKPLDNQLLDIARKQTSKTISIFYESGVQVIVIGDIRDIRLDNNLGKKNNQKIHQMPHGIIRHMLSYKAEGYGMRVVLENEAYTSQECIVCGKRNKPRNRNYSCECGFKYHRDGVGAINIWKKYRGESHVAGVMASPLSMRYNAHMICSLQQ